MAHLNREKVPERRPHARGAGAFGVFETTENVSRHTSAALLQKGTSTETLARFSTIAGEMGSSDTGRNVRGFSLKFYTSEGNCDLVGNTAKDRIEQVKADWRARRMKPPDLDNNEFVPLPPEPSTPADPLS